MLLGGGEPQLPLSLSISNNTRQQGVFGGKSQIIGTQYSESGGYQVIK